MRVLLVQSYLGDNEAPVYPIGLASLAASLTPEHAVSLFDPNVSEKPFEGIRERIVSFQPDVVGVSLRNIDSTNKRRVVDYFPLFQQVLSVVRKNSDVPLVVGGSGFSMFAQEIMEREAVIDLGLYLEGEETFKGLLQRLDAPESCPSVYFRKEGKILFSGQGPLLSPAEVKLPRRDLIDPKLYRKNRDAMGVETKRGCPLNCVYCVYGFLNGKPYRLRDPEQVVEDIESLAKQGGDRFTFVDSVFNLPREHAASICRLLVERKNRLRWSAWFSEKGMDRDFLQLAKAAGCDHVIFSPDGYRDDVLQRLGKVQSTQDIHRAFQVVSSFPDVEVSYNFFKNPPGQNLRNFLGAALFCLRGKQKLGGRFHVELSSLRIEPHTRLYKIAVQEGIIQEGQSVLFPTPYGQSRTRYLEFLTDALLWLAGK